MKNKKPATKKKSALTVDFSGVETRVLVPEGQYHAKVFKAPEMNEGSEYGYLKWVFAIIDDNPKINNQKAYTNTSLAPQALWNLRNLLETLGVDTPDSEMELTPDEYVDLELMIRIEHETYEGKDRVKVSDFSPVEETTETEDDETPETDDEDEAEEDEEEEDDAPPAKPAKPAGKKAAVKEEEPEEEAEEEVEEEEDTEDEAEEEAEGPTLTTEEVMQMDDAELASLIKEHSLPVKLKTIPKQSKRCAAVAAALEAADLLAE